MPWVLEYFRAQDLADYGNKSILFQEVYLADKEPAPLKFRRYDRLTERVRDLQEYGSERVNYRIVPNGAGPADIKYSFIILGEGDTILAQSPFVFNKKTKQQAENQESVVNDIEEEIKSLIRYFGFQFDLYCEANPCDNNEDPYSFRTTALLPCWPKRFQDATFRNLVEKTIQTQFPAHIHTRVVWVGVQEMQRFEKAFYAWLQEMKQTETPGYDKVNPLVEVLNTLRPCGTCEDEC